MNFKGFFKASVLPVVAVSFLLTSCVDTTPPNAKIIPAETSGVFTLNQMSMVTKANVKKLTELQFFKSMERGMTQSEEGAKMYREFTANPLFSGIDLFANVYAFAGGENPARPEYSCISMKLNDSDQLKSFVEGLPGNYQVVDGPIRYADIVETPMAIAWNDDVVVMILVNDFEADKIDIAKNILNLPEEKSWLATNEDFKNFALGSQDAGLYLSWEALKMIIEENRFIASVMSKQIDELTKGNYSRFDLNFEDDRVVFEMENFTTDMFKEKYLMLKDEGVSDEFLNYMTDGDLMGVLSMNYDLNKLVDLVNSDDQVSGMLGEIQKQANLSNEEVKSLLTGEIVFTFVDIHEEEITVEADPDFGQEAYSFSTEQPTIFLGAGYTDKAKVAELLELAGAEKRDGYYFMNGGYIVLTDNIGVSASTESDAQKLAKAGAFSSYSKHDIDKLITKNPLAGYFNLDLSTYPEAILKDLKREGSAKYGAVEEQMKKVTDIRLYGSPVTKVTLELNTDDPDNNSLFTIISAVDQLSAL